MPIGTFNKFLHVLNISKPTDCIYDQKPVNTATIELKTKAALPTILIETLIDEINQSAS